MSKKISIGMTIAISAITATVTFSVGYMSSQNKMSHIIDSISDRQVMYDKLNEIDTAIRKNYNSDVDIEALNEGICKGYVDGLNESQAKYLSPNEYTMYNAMLNVSNTVKSEIIQDNIGYITISSFSSQTRTELNNIINNLKQNGAEKFIINLRDCSCNNIEYACDTADLFVSCDVMLYKCYGKEQYQEAFLGNSDAINEKIVLLVNGNTSGSGEIFSLLLKENLKTSIIGSQTSGNTAICTITPLSDGSAVIIPNGEYVTENHTSINNIGIVPEYEVHQSYSIDSQLQKAIEVINNI